MAPLQQRQQLRLDGLHYQSCKLHPSTTSPPPSIFHSHASRPRVHQRRVVSRMEGRRSQRDGLIPSSPFFSSQTVRSHHQRGCFGRGTSSLLLPLLAVVITIAFTVEMGGRGGSIVLGVDGREVQCPEQVEKLPCILRVKGGDTVKFSCKNPEPLGFPETVYGHTGAQLQLRSYIDVESVANVEVEYTEKAEKKKGEEEKKEAEKKEAEKKGSDEKSKKEEKKEEVVKKKKTVYTIKIKKDSKKKACVMATCAEELAEITQKPQNYSDKELQNRTKRTLLIQVNGGEPYCSDDNRFLKVIE